MYYGYKGDNLTPKSLGEKLLRLLDRVDFSNGHQIGAFVDKAKTTIFPYASPDTLREFYVGQLNKRAPRGRRDIIDDILDALLQPRIERYRRETGKDPVGF